MWCFETFFVETDEKIEADGVECNIPDVEGNDSHINCCIDAHHGLGERYTVQYTRLFTLRFDRAQIFTLLFVIFF